ncbi:hypothetical protein CYMTET_11589 [Cymbomonas tetramitiformis]|uniref:Uncharacterized protein n=1 Tax=Cymbomonas tetramitiformis TaxID=36881 RepID=A0AAE0GM89_9CHLO|nr:hypothetical protein CYMTET_11589 [Cymbomonas tetramitiformis]
MKEAARGEGRAAQEAEKAEREKNKMLAWRSVLAGELQQLQVQQERRGQAFHTILSYMGGESANGFHTSRSIPSRGTDSMAPDVPGSSVALHSSGPDIAPSGSLTTRSLLMDAPAADPGSTERSELPITRASSTSQLGDDTIPLVKFVGRAASASTSPTRHHRPPSPASASATTSPTRRHRPASRSQMGGSGHVRSLSRPESPLSNAAGPLAAKDAHNRLRAAEETLNAFRTRQSNTDEKEEGMLSARYNFESTEYAL